MKRSALQCVAGFVGATLVVVGVVWTCSQLSAPTQLNAAQGTISKSKTTAQSVAAPKRPSGSLTLSVTPQGDSTAAAKPQIASKQPELLNENKIRPTSGGSLDLSVVDSDDALSAAPTNVESSTLDAFDPFDKKADPIEIQSPSLNARPQKLQQEEDTFPSFDGAASPDEFSDAPFPQSENNSSLTISSPEPQQVVPQTTNNVNSVAPQPLNAPDDEVDVDANVAEDIEDDPLAFPTQTPSAQPVVEQTPVVATPIPSLPQEQDAPRQAAPVAQSLPAAAPAPRSSANFGTAQNSGKLSDALLQYVAKDAASKADPDENLQGPQAAQIAIEKRAPAEVQTNKPTTVAIVVKNVGDKPIKNVLLRDSVPTGAKFETESSGVQPNAQGELIWPVFELQAGAEKQFEYTITPTQEGEIGSVATAMIVASASCQTKSSHPELKVDVTAPEKVEIGQDVAFNIVVTNVGSGVANNVVLQENIPDGLHHPSGSVLSNNLGQLQAGESKSLPLTLQSVAAGLVVNNLSISADDCETTTAETKIEIVAPMLELAIAGPQNVYLEKETTYKLAVKNVGDASAFDVKLVAQLPDGVDFVKANNLGAYKEDEHSVFWDLAELPAQTNADIELTVKTTKACKADLVFGATGPNNLTAQTSQTISIDGIAALSFNVSSSTDLVEVGKEFEYTVQIENRGTKASSNVVLQVRIPEVISILGTSGPTNATNRRGVVVFGKIDSIPAKSNVKYKIKATPNTPGDCRVGFQLSSDDLEPLAKEENTRVYE